MGVSTQYMGWTMPFEDPMAMSETGTSVSSTETYGSSDRSVVLTHGGSKRSLDLPRRLGELNPPPPEESCLQLLLALIAILAVGYRICLICRAQQSSAQSDAQAA